MLYLQDMTKLLSALVALLMPLAVLSAADDAYKKYIEKYSDLAVKEMKRTGVPASISLAQGLLESNAGRSTLAKKGNNHFGIKCHNDWTGKTMRMDDDRRRECFRVYPNVEASYRDHSDFLRSNDRYKALFELKKDDYKGWARGLKKSGYATDPAYANKLIAIIEEYELYRFDKKVKVEKKTPREVEAPRPVTVQESKKIFNESHKFSMSKQVYEQNGVPFVYAHEGETYRSIAAANGLFLKEILRFNDLDREMSLKTGDIVYLAHKKSKGAKGTYKYVVGRDGETMRDISQRFAIKLDKLEKMNPALKGKRLQEGDTVMLRK